MVLDCCVRHDDVTEPDVDLQRGASILQDCLGGQPHTGIVGVILGDQSCPVRLSAANTRSSDSSTQHNLM